MPTIKFIPIDQYAQNVCEAPPPAKDLLPDWYRSLSPDVPGVRFTGTNTTSSMKRCIPVFDYLTSGYVINFWADVMFSNNPCDDPNCQDYSPGASWRAERTVIESHHSDQFKGMPIPEGFYGDVAFKLNSQFLIKTPPGYSTMFVPMLEVTPNLYAIPGVVDTDKHPVAINFPFLIKNRFEGLIEKGTPLVRVIPFKRESWRGLVLEQQEADIKTKSERMKTVMYRAYKNNFWSKKDWN